VALEVSVGTTRDYGPEVKDLVDETGKRFAVASRRAVLATLLLAGCGAAGSAAKRAATRSSSATARTGAPTAAQTAAPTAKAATPAAPPAPTGPAIEIVNGSRTRQQVALTFHGNGDPALAEQLLVAAEAQRAKITVFAVGNWLQANPAIGRRILSGGHELANHTFTHPDLGTLAQPAVEAEFAQARDVIQQVSGNNGIYARPSAMDRATPLVLAAAGVVGYRTVVAFDVDPSDYLDPGSQAVVDRTLAAVQPGSIVSLHLGHVGTLQALPAILDGLSSRGLQAVTVRTLLT
jgi:peptidoglycan/xylan/chitin deacetylase (PgdA/CDA1 family)